MQVMTMQGDPKRNVQDPLAVPKIVELDFQGFNFVVSCHFALAQLNAWRKQQGRYEHEAECMVKSLEQFH